MPELDVEDLRRHHLAVAIFAIKLTNVVHEVVVEHRAFGVEEGAGRRLFVQAEQIELGTQATVVAGARLLHQGLVLFELFDAAEGGAVDALQHFARFIAAVVDARAFEQLDRADLLRALHVRTAAQVGEPAVAVEGDRFALGDVFEPFELELGAHFAENAAGFLAAHFDPFEGDVLRQDLPHLLFDLDQIVAREGLLAAEVVLELLGVVEPAGVDLGARPKTLDGVGEHVFGTVAQDRAGFGVFAGEESETPARLDRRAQVDRLPFELGAHGGLGKARTDRTRDIERRHASGDGSRGAVREDQLEGGIGVAHGTLGRIRDSKKRQPAQQRQTAEGGEAGERARPVKRRGRKRSGRR